MHFSADHPLGRATDAEQHVGAGAGRRGGDGAVDVAVAYEPDASTGAAHLIDQVAVAVPVEDDDREIAHALPLGLGDPSQVLRGRGRDVDGADGVRADGDLLHVDAGSWVEHRAALADGDDRQRVAPAQGGQGGAVDGVHGDVAERRRAVAHLLAVEQHRRFVLLALADHDHAVHRHGRQHRPHGFDGGAVGTVLVAPAHPARAGECGSLGGPHQLEGEVAVRALRPDRCRRGHEGAP
jgi:hypothetical protein